MRNWILVLVGLCLMTGCEPAQQGYYEKLAAVVNESVDAQQSSSRAIVAALEESQLLPAAKLSEIEAQLNKVDKYVDSAQAAAVEAAKVYEAKQAENKLLAIIEAGRAANAVTAPVNPYAGLIEGVLGLAAVVAGGYGFKKHKDLSTVAKKYEAHKRGVEGKMRSSDPRRAQDLYDTIGTERRKLGIL